MIYFLIRRWLGIHREMYNFHYSKPVIFLCPDQEVLRLAHKSCLYYPIYPSYAELKVSGPVSILLDMGCIQHTVTYLNMHTLTSSLRQTDRGRTVGQWIRNCSINIWIDNADFMPFTGHMSTHKSDCFEWPGPYKVSAILYSCLLTSFLHRKYSSAF